MNTFKTHLKDNRDMYWKILLLLTVFGSWSGVKSDPVPYCGVTFVFASYYDNFMVLQRAPARARIWGYAFNAGDSVTLTINVGGQDLEYTTTSVDGTAGRPIWSIDIDPVEEGGPYNISVTSVDCTLTLTDVLFGDVWICSGQSNMVHFLQNIDNPEPDLEDTVNYPNVRTFYAEQRFTDTPQEDLVAVRRSWALPTPENMAQYSAVCWLFGVELYKKYQRPIGLVNTCWGGTRIEAWSSPEALDQCFEEVPPREDQNAASVLYNAMIHPFLPMPIYGGIWYQGEANQGNALDYGCAINAMVNDWRARWFAETDSMDPQFPFGQVQLAPNDNNDNIEGFPDVRWHQTAAYGYTPNDLLQRFFLSVAVDLADYDSPQGSVHPRYKRQIATRLALGAFDIAYSDQSNGTHQGPFPTAFAATGGNIVITHDGGNTVLEQRGDPASYTSYEVCCSADPTVFCPGADTSWVLAEITTVAGADVTITAPCAEGQVVTGVRYLWRVSPCDLLEQCPIYADAAGNSLPSPPYVYNGLISAANLQK